MRPSSIVPRVSVIGLGNILLGDDGFGSWTIEAFRTQYECGPEVEVIDVGTPGLDLAPYLYGRDLVVIVDAINADGRPGTVHVYNESAFLPCDAQLRLTDHEQGLQESLTQLQLVDRAPEELIVIGVIPQSCVFGTKISDTVLDASSAVIGAIVDCLRQHGFNCRRRVDPIQENSWWKSELERCLLLRTTTVP